MRFTQFLSPFKARRPRAPGTRLRLESLEDRSLPSTGVIITDLGAWSYGSASFLDGNDDIVIAGGMTISHPTTNVLAGKYQSSGLLDITFGSQGLTTTDVLRDSSSYGQAVVPTPDGKIVLGATVEEKWPGTGLDFALIRYRDDGSLDTTFGSGKKGNTAGVVHFDLGGNDRLHDIIVLGDGSIIAAGSSNVSGAFQFTVVKVTPSGQLDTSFGSNGVIQTVLNSTSEINAITLHQGKILAVGRAFSPDTTSDDVALARYELNGQLDTSFGSGGTVVMHLSPQPGGHGGDYARAVAIDTDDNIVIGGHSAGPEGDYMVARFTPDGTLDPTFGNGGQSRFRLNDSGGLGTSGEVTAVALQPDGKIVVTANAAGGAQEFKLARLLPDGTLDASFDGDGRIATPIRDVANARSVVIQSDGKIVASGSSLFDGSYRSVTLARYHPDGTLDTSFGEAPPSFSVDDVSVTEGDSGTVAATFTVTRTDSTGTASVQFATADGSATIANNDYQSRSGLLSFADGQATRTVTVLVNGDTVQEGNETFLVNLFSPVNGGIGDGQGVGTILNDDGGKGKGNKLVAASLGDNADADSQPLTAKDAAPLLEAAIARLLEGIDGHAVSELATVQIRITDLPGTTLGMAVGDTIWLDSDAAGWGWFIDPTPWDDSEFITPGDQGEQNRMDLLTVIRHELGHILGHDHEDDGLMSPTLAAGTRLDFDHDHDEPGVPTPAIAQEVALSAVLERRAVSVSARPTGPQVIWIGGDEDEEDRLI